MDIQNAQWTGLNSDIITCTCNGEQISVPADPDNRHYAEIMRQVDEEGLVIAEPD